MTIIVGLILGCVILLGFFEMRNKHINIWLGSYLRGFVCTRRLRVTGKVKHVLFCFVDHFEPPWNKASQQTQWNRLNAWVQTYPVLASRHKDVDGKSPQHTFFCAEEEYNAEQIERLAGICKEGFGEIEVHLHHHHDTSDGLKNKLAFFKEKLLSHQCLSVNARGRVGFGFIHGNWALDNSGADSSSCGVNDEFIVLRDSGCYADFTLPSAPSVTQTSKINSIYYASDDPIRPKSHNSGVDVEVGKAPSGDLMIIQGPLMLDFGNRKWGLFPRIENGDISGDNPPVRRRIDLWIRSNIVVKNRPEWVFVKVHTHGCQEKNFGVLLGNQAEQLYDYLETKYNDGKQYKLHYVTAREMYNIVKAAESGLDGDPNDYRDYVFKKVSL